MSVTRVLILAVAVVGFMGLKLLPPWVADLRLKGAIHDVVREGQLSTDAAMISAVVAAAQELKVPLASSAIHVERRGAASIRVWAEYDVTVTLPLGFSHTQRFRPEVRSRR